VDIPVIAVFTKYDELVNEQITESTKARANLFEVEQNAKIYFNDRVRDFRRRTPVPAVKVSTSEEYPSMSPSCYIEKISHWHLGHLGSFKSLLELTKVTRKCLGDIEEAGTLLFTIELSARCVLFLDTLC